MCQDIGIVPTDIIPMIKYAWNHSFAKVRTNQRAIALRGWNPYNRILLLHKDIRVTMTDDERDEELEQGLLLTVVRTPAYQTVVGMNENLLLEDTNNLVRRSNQPLGLNCTSGTASEMLKVLVCDTDHQIKQNEIAKDKVCGEQKLNTMKELKKKLSSGGGVSS